MALSPEANSIPANEIVDSKPHQEPLRFSQAEINRFMHVPPSPELLSEGHPVITPVGEWHQEGIEIYFKPIQQGLIDQMTIPDTKTKVENFLKSAIKKYGQMD